MTSRPLILVPGDVRTLDRFTWHAANETYLRSAFDVAGVTPLILPAFGESIARDALDAVSGVLLTGSRSNVDPRRYGASAGEEHQPLDPARDATSLPVITAAIAKDLPLLAICRGHQELNVALGGSIVAEVQDQPGKDDHRGGPVDAPVDQRFAPNHTITIKPDGLLASLVGRDALMVNSVHRQAIDRLADGLKVEAVADDGTVEAVSVSKSQTFALGVQWHPEYWTSQSAGTDAPSTQIFKGFGDAVRAYTAATAGKGSTTAPATR